VIRGPVFLWGGREECLISEKIFFGLRGEGGFSVNLCMPHCIIPQAKQKSDNLSYLVESKWGICWDGFGKTRQLKEASEGEGL
jgi:hypothetical protein